MPPAPSLNADIKTVVAENDPAQRNQILHALAEAGYTDITVVDTLAGARSVVKSGPVDLLIGATTLPDGSLASLLSAMRHKRIGDNPFVVAVALLADSESDTVNRAVNGSFDAIAVKPIDPARLIRRLETLKRGRQPFVVTMDYMGPDRRSAPRDDGMDIPQIKVPNPLALRSGGLDRKKMKRLTDLVYTTLNAEKVDRYVHQLGWLRDKIEPLFDGALTVEEDALPPHMRRLAIVARDLNHRIGASHLSHAQALAMTLDSVARELADAPDFETADKGRWRMLLDLMKALSHAADPEAGVTPRDLDEKAATGVSPLLDRNMARKRSA